MDLEMGELNLDPGVKWVTLRPTNKEPDPEVVPTWHRMNDGTDSTLCGNYPSNFTRSYSSELPDDGFSCKSCLGQILSKPGAETFRLLEASIDVR
jgi:hypothetical protein